MMKLPTFKSFQFPSGETASVFQDDALFNKFYIIPGFPAVRIDAKGNPVFMLIKYNLSDQSREENPELPRGGGYMVFDSELKVSVDAREEILTDLEDYVNREWERMKNGPNDRVRTLRVNATFNDNIGGHWGGSGHEGTPRASGTTSQNTFLQIPGHGDVPPRRDEPAPPVLIGEPLWVSGKVKMNAPTAPGLVSGILAERPASLVGNNVAAFSLDLTPDGASFMEQTLVGPEGAGATDLTPIQVEYQLTMLAKLPPASLFIKFNTSQVYHACQELFHEHSNCSDDYFTSENMMSTAITAGLITVKIDMGGVTDDDIEQMLTQQAMSTVQQLLTDRFASKERAPMEEWANEDVAESSAEIYRLKRITEVDMTDFEQRMEFNATTEFTIAPQGTLSAFFRDQTDMKPFVRVVNANDPFFMTLGLKARAFANWEEDSVAFVELEVKYDHGGEIKTNTFTFTPESKEAQEWDPSLIDGKRDYKYRWRIAFEGREAGEWSKWEKSTSRDLNVSVETPGKLNVEVTGVGLDFENIVDAVLVHLRYEDTSNDIPLGGHSVLIVKDKLSGTWTRQLFAPWEKPIEYRVDYLLKNGVTLEAAWKKTEGPVQNILIPRPDIDVLDLTLVPAGRWGEVIQAVLSLRYADGDYNRDAQFNFKTPDEFKKWGVLLQNPSKRKFEYKVLATFKNGDTQETTWLAREGDQALPVLVEGPPRLEVKLTGAVLDVASTPVTKVDFEYVDPQGERHQDSYSLQKPEDVHTWSIPVRKDGPRTYRYKTTYFPAQGDPVERDWETTETELIVVPRYSIPKVGAQVSPVLQDFALTPAIEVDLSYNDPQRGDQEHMTLVFTGKEPQTWFIPVPDDAPREYTMTTTWHYADGTQRASTPVRLTKPSILLPRPPAAVAAGGVN
jgi:hypothetical protein